MTIRTEDWNAVGDALEGLALKLKLHFESTADASGKAVKGAVDEVGEAVERSFDALRNAIDDPSVKENVKDVALKFRDAFVNTVNEVTGASR